jgi:hypothetical protein
MARGRMVSTTVATDKRLADLSLTAEYLYLKTIPHLDRDGLILGDAPLLWGKVAVRRPELLPMTEDLISEWLAQDGLVIAYDTPDGCALYFPGFAKNQVGMRYDREPESTIACPPGFARTPAGLVPDGSRDASGNHPADFRQPSGNHPSEVKGIEVKREVKGKEKNLAPAALEEDLTLEIDDNLTPAQRAVRNAYDASGLMMSKTHLDTHLETIKRTGLTAWRAGWSAASDKGKQNIPNFVARCAETSMLAEQRGNGYGNGQHAEPESIQDKLQRAYALMDAQKGAAGGN